ncbi:MAG: PKD domain-containing protein [Methanosarcinaceae archaeon]|nr:PKD domain-containing protein [Methanosarcinaceae archaeon]
MLKRGVVQDSSLDYHKKASLGVDISDPSNPTLAGKNDTAGSLGVAVSGSYAYVTDWYNRLVVVDISDLVVSELEASFSVELTAPLTMQFTDASIGATEWFWDFGDGNTSTDQNPTHTYADIGEYTIEDSD